MQNQIQAQKKLSLSRGEFRAKMFHEQMQFDKAGGNLSAQVEHMQSKPKDKQLVQGIAQWEREIMKSCPQTERPRCRTKTGKIYIYINVPVCCLVKGREWNVDL